LKGEGGRRIPKKLSYLRGGQKIEKGKKNQSVHKTRYDRKAEKFLSITTIIAARDLGSWE